MKTSRRDFLKLAGKATVAAATAGATVKAGAEVKEVFTPAYVTADDIDAAREVLDKHQVYVSAPVAQPMATAGPDLHTNDMPLIYFEMSASAHTVTDIPLGARPLTSTLVGANEFTLDVYTDVESFPNIVPGERYRLHVDHHDVADHVRGVYNVVADGVITEQSQGTFITAKLHFREVY